MKKRKFIADLAKYVITIKSDEKDYHDLLALALESVDDEL